MPPSPAASTARSVLRAPTRLGFREAVIIAVVLVVFRSAVWVFDEGAHFDSDQAIVGLMAKHLAEGRAFPLYFYGQHYLLGVEAWLAAPVFWVAGATVTALKLPLLALNLAVACLLLWILVRREGLVPADALVVASFFILPSLTVSSRFVEAQGGNIEPLLYVLLLWLLRDRPIAGGLLAGFAIVHREFSIYAIAAILVVDVVSRRAFTRSRIRDYFMAFGAMNVTWFAFRLLKQHADISGPGTAGALTGGAGELRGLGSFHCWNPAEFQANLRWLVTDNLGTLFGWQAWTHALGKHTMVTGGPWMAVVLACALIATLVVLVRKRSTLGHGTNWMLPCYLAVVGVQAALVYALFGCVVRDGTLVRYTLLTIFVPIGAFTLVLSVDPGLRWRRGILTLIVIFSLLTLIDHARYVSAWVRHPLRDPHRDLANLLELEGVRYAWAPYWTAYELTFLTQERVTVASSDIVRITEYQRAVQEHDAQSVWVSEDSSCPPEGVAFGTWCLMNLDRARGTRSR